MWVDSNSSDWPYSSDCDINMHGQPWLAGLSSPALRHASGEAAKKATRAKSCCAAHSQFSVMKPSQIAVSLSHISMPQCSIEILPSHLNVELEPAAAAQLESMPSLHHKVWYSDFNSVKNRVAPR